MTDGLSAADVALLSGRNNDGWGGDWMGMIALFFLFSMLGWGGYGGFGGFGNGERVATVGDVQRGFDTQNIISKLDGINSGLCDGFYAQNSTMLNISNNLQRDLCTGFANTNAAVQQARFDAQQCCCETNRNIDAVRYENAKNTCDIMQNSNAGVQKILDAITGNRMADMQNQINQLQLNAALCGVVRYPNQTTYTAGYSPCFSGYGNGCGCCGNGNI